MGYLKFELYKGRLIFLIATHFQVSGLVKKEVTAVRIWDFLCMWESIDHPCSFSYRRSESSLEYAFQPAVKLGLSSVHGNSRLFWKVH